jgi:hypothetical protein
MYDEPEAFPNVPPTVNLKPLDNKSNQLDSLSSASDVFGSSQ